MIGRGHVWWGNFDKLRPGVIVSSDRVCDLDFWQVHLVPISTSGWHADFPYSAPIRFPGTGDPCFATTLDLRLLARHQLIDYVGELDVHGMTAVDATLRSSFALD